MHTKKIFAFVLLSGVLSNCRAGQSKKEKIIAQIAATHKAINNATACLQHLDNQRDKDLLDEWGSDMTLLTQYTNLTKTIETLKQKKFELEKSLEDEA